MYWAMRTFRKSRKIPPSKAIEIRNFLNEELFSKGRLRQGWGWESDQDLRKIREEWRKTRVLNEAQNEANANRFMLDGNPPNDHMNVGDIVLAANMPSDGTFTLCRITRPYEYNISEHGDFGHILPVEVLTPNGVANNHELVDAGLRKSMRCRKRMWRISAHSDSLEAIIRSDVPAESLAQGVTVVGRIESIVDELITEPINMMAKELATELPKFLQGAEWETGILPALELLFPATIEHTGGRSEQGADLEVIISNPFDDSRNWIVPIQIKDHQGIEGEGVVHQLKEAYDTRNKKDNVDVIAVVLLVTGAEPSSELKEQMSQLSDEKGVPFIFCGGEDLMQILARGFLKRI